MSRVKLQFPTLGPITAQLDGVELPGDVAVTEVRQEGWTCTITVDGKTLLVTDVKPRSFMDLRNWTSIWIWEDIEVVQP